MARDQRISDFGPAQPTQSNQVWATEAGAISAARGEAEDSSGTHLTPALESALPANATLTTIGAFDAEQGIDSDPLIAADRPVWVVVVHGNMETTALPGSAAPEFKSVFTDVFDAPTGDLILRAIGVDASK